MADNAEVRSLERVEQFLCETEHYRTQLMKEIENLQLELRRLTNWISTDAREYWSTELIKSRRVLAESQDTLTRCMSYVRAEERRPCTEEKKRLRLAQQRRATCEQMLRTVNSAASLWEREQTKSVAKIQNCQDLAESGLLVATNQLRGQIEQLRTYTSLRSAGVTTETRSNISAQEDAAQPSDSEDATDSTQSSRKH